MGCMLACVLLYMCVGIEIHMLKRLMLGVFLGCSLLSLDGAGSLLSLEITKLAGLVRQFVMGYSFSVSRALRLQVAAIPTHF